MPFARSGRRRGVFALSQKGRALAFVASALILSATTFAEVLTTAGATGISPRHGRVLDTGACQVPSNRFNVPGAPKFEF